MKFQASIRPTLRSEVQASPTESNPVKPVKPNHSGSHLSRVRAGCRLEGLVMAEKKRAVLGGRRPDTWKYGAWRGGLRLNSTQFDQVRPNSTKNYSGEEPDRNPRRGNERICSLMFT